MKGEKRALSAGEGQYCLTNQMPKIEAWERICCSTKLEGPEKEKGASLPKKGQATLKGGNPMGRRVIPIEFLKHPLGGTR